MKDFKEKLVALMKYSANYASYQDENMSRFAEELIELINNEYKEYNKQSADWSVYDDTYLGSD